MPGRPEETHRARIRDLRTRAEAQVDRWRAGQPPERHAPPSEELLHELLVFQAELELQTDELQKTCEELNSAREEYGRLFDLTPVGVIALDAQGVVRKVNGAAARMFGNRSRFLLGKPLSIYVAATDQPEYLHQLRNAAGGNGRPFEIRMVLHGEGSFAARFRFQHVQASRGNYTLLATIEDITEEKKHAEHHRQAEKLEAIGRLAGGIAHDFNNLMTVILGHATRELSHPGAAESWGAVKHAADMGASLTRRLLLFARNAQIEPARNELNTLLRTFVDTVAAVVSPAAKLVLQTAPEPVECIVDERELGNALLNLVFNSRDHSPPGGRIEIVLSRLTIDPADHAAIAAMRGQQCAAIDVVDYGVGMAEDVARRIFDPFFSTKRDGAGLGLSAVRGFVEQSGGSVKVDSTPGVGTRIRLMLPLAPKEVPAPPETPHLASSLPLRKLRTLIVEDNRHVRRLIKMLATDVGLEVQETETGDQARELLERHGRDIDLIISDVVMPGSVSGVDLAMYCRERFPGIRVLLSSGYIPAEPPPLPPLTDFLPKPFSKSELETKIKSLFAAENA